jgi:hypothetical protein
VHFWPSFSLREHPGALQGSRSKKRLFDGNAKWHVREIALHIDAPGFLGFFEKVVSKALY